MNNFAKKTPLLTACIISFGLGAIAIFAYSPFDYWGVIFISALGLLWSATLAHKKHALFATLSWSLGYFAIGINWVQVSMTQFGGVPEWLSYLIVIGLAFYLSLYNLLFCYGVHHFSLSNPFGLAALFTFTEYLRGIVFTGFPWLQFGYSLIDSPFIGLAPLLGVQGLTFFIIMISGSLLFCWKTFAQKRHFSTAYSSLCVLSLLVAWASSHLQFIQIDQTQKPLNVSLIQGNIEQKIKWDPKHLQDSIFTYNELLQSTYSENNVIILPESAIAATESYLTEIYQHWHQQAQQYGSELIVGSLYDDQAKQQLFNSAFVLGNTASHYSAQNTPRYNKHHLVPFGEYVPLGNLLDWLREVFILPINLSQGEFIQKPLFAQNKRFNMAICYEIIFGDQVQRNQSENPSDYLLTITNDAWFGESVGPWQHFQIARMRALELGKPLLRAANTGITAIVNADGKIQAQLPQFEKGVLNATVYPTVGVTPFTRYGNLLIYLISLICFALSLTRKKA